MKKNRILIGLIFLLLFCINIGADTDTQNDPLVTKSYVDKIVAEQVKQAVAEQIEAEAVPNNSFIVLHMDKGSRLYGDEGTEFILRSGEAYATTGTNGPMIDVTAGADLSENEALIKNHLLLCPRNDGRAIVAKTEVYIMVKGNYELRSN